jgi:hypothetical protein
MRNRNVDYSFSRASYPLCNACYDKKRSLVSIRTCLCIEFILYLMFCSNAMFKLSYSNCLMSIQKNETFLLDPLEQTTESSTKQYAMTVIEIAMSLYGCIVFRRKEERKVFRCNDKL